MNNPKKYSVRLKINKKYIILLKYINILEIIEINFTFILQFFFFEKLLNFTGMKLTLIV